MVRAWLFLTVLMLWAACLAGAVGLPLVLAARAWLARRPARHPAVGSPMIASASASAAASSDHIAPAPPVPDVAQPADYGSLLVLLYGYAVAMGLGALFLSGLLFAPMGDGELADTFAWMALPLWSAVMALLVARSLRSPQRVRGSMR
jgi:hypothetical protein